MSVKFKVGFTIDAQVLFGMLSKFLPVDDLHVEEVIEQPTPDPAIRFDRRFDLPKSSKPKQYKQKQKRAIRSHSARVHPTRTQGGGPNLKEGSNAVVLELLSDGKPHRAVEMKPLFAARGYAPTGSAARLGKLRDFGVIFQPEVGLWQLAKQGE
jgi:hypothetical protein